MSIKLLVADDSITIQKVIGIIFGGEDYSLTIVDNGKSAIEKAREICPDVLLIDALMPGMTGYEVSEAVRATPALANKPILILTGSFEPFDEEKAKKCGADDFLAKPFESQQIVNKVKELAELGAAREHAVPPLQTPVDSTPHVISTTFAEASETPVFAQQTATTQTFAPTDIWGAFTPEIESPVTPTAEAAQFAAAQTAAPFEFAAEPDVFAIVNEESGSQLVQPAAVPDASPQNTGSQWIPVEEHTFEFEEETVPDLPVSAYSEQTSHTRDSAFGDIAFEDDEPLQTSTIAAPVSAPFVETAAAEFSVAQPVSSSFDEPAPALSTPLASGEEQLQPDQTTTPEFSTPWALPAGEFPALAVVPAALSEDQLKSAISAASKEVIERIVWEVVPDLAEALIKEAIRKIREGQ
ncbi:MAG: response regulator [Steroidobacteraceae bacterium]|nr:response regulator [Deltaproteobacteria bacterium]